MGWWRSENGENIIGDVPADILVETFEKMKSSTRRTPALQDLLNAAVAALNQCGGEWLEGGEVALKGLSAELNERGGYVSSTSSAPDPNMVKLLSQAFEDIMVTYEETEMRRKPKLDELLETVAFVLGPDDQDFASVPERRGVFRISAVPKP
jgi:hypothetical protein